MSPTVARVGPYRLFFFSHEPNEPPHIHIDREVRSAKFWLSPVSLASNRGYSPRELRDIERIVGEQSVRCLEAWYAYFGYPRR